MVEIFSKKMQPKTATALVAATTATTNVAAPVTEHDGDGPRHPNVDGQPAPVTPIIVQPPADGYGSDAEAVA
eukprot:6330419-Heterocapsa_arctica.AAC.1